MTITLKFQTGTLTRGKPVVSAISSIHYGESEILQIAAAVEKTASHPIAKAIVNKAESLELVLPVTKGQIVEPGFGTLAEIDGRLVAVGSLEWVHERFHSKMNPPDLVNLEHTLMNHSSDATSSNYSKTVVYVGREGEGIIGAIAISDIVREDAESTVTRYVYIAVYVSSEVRKLATHFRQTILLLLPIICEFDSCHFIPSEKGLCFVLHVFQQQFCFFGPYVNYHYFLSMHVVFLTAYSSRNSFRKFYGIILSGQLMLSYSFVKRIYRFLNFSSFSFHVMRCGLHQMVASFLFH